MAHRSIMMNLDNDVCFLCGRRGNVQCHHVMHGSANRKLAEQDGLMVNLCFSCHHILHDTGRGDKELMKVAEARWLDYNFACVDDFIARYGKNYLD